MRWKKLGVLWKPDGSLWWAKKYATCPTPLFLKDGTLRLYLQSRDEHNVGRIGYIDLDPSNPLKVLRAASSPILGTGKAGTFDEHGVLQTSIASIRDHELYLYYVGFELGQDIRYRLFTGLAVSSDHGETFQRFHEAPILVPSSQERYFRGGPFVLPKVTGGFQMWYVAGSEWEEINGKSMPVYDLRYMESSDGIHWPQEGEGVLQLDRETEHGFGRPYIVKKENLYQMFYSIRKKNPCAYRLGYAESCDGIHWERKDQELGLDVSAEGWDSESIEYSAIVEIDSKTYCFYNGSDFGATGVGVAELIR